MACVYSTKGKRSYTQAEWEWPAYAANKNKLIARYRMVKR